MDIKISVDEFTAFLEGIAKCMTANNKVYLTIIGIPSIRVNEYIQKGLQDFSIDPERIKGISYVQDIVTEIRSHDILIMPGQRGGGES